MVKQIEKSIKVSELTELIALSPDTLLRIKDHSEIGDSYDDILNKLMDKVND